jgi:hypothetical protein
MRSILWGKFFDPYNGMIQKVVTKDVSVTGSQNFFFAIFGNFERYVTNSYNVRDPKSRDQRCISYWVHNFFLLFSVLLKGI